MHVHSAHAMIYDFLFFVAVIDLKCSGKKGNPDDFFLITLSYILFSSVWNVQRAMRVWIARIQNSWRICKNRWENFNGIALCLGQFHQLIGILAVRKWLQFIFNGKIRYDQLRKMCYIRLLWNGICLDDVHAVIRKHIEKIQFQSTQAISKLLRQPPRHKLYACIHHEITHLSLDSLPNPLGIWDMKREFLV